jgi:hypothetical protein
LLSESLLYEARSRFTSTSAFKEAEMAQKDDEKKGTEGTPSTSETGESAAADAKSQEREVKYGLREPARAATEEFSGPIIGFVRDTLTGTLRATGTVANDAVEVVRDVLTGAVHATEEVGAETLGAVGTICNGVVTTARDILVGSVDGVKEVLGSAVPMRRTPEEAGRTREPSAASH